MRKARWWRLAALVAAVLLALVACGGDDDDGDASGDTGSGEAAELQPATLQLKWVTQAQFAGYYAALDQGYYEDEGIDLTIKPGGPDIVPEQVVLGGQAEFGLNWLDNTLATRDQGGEIVNIAQVFARSGMTEVTWADSGLDDITALEGKKVGVWLGGNEHKLFAALTKNGIDPDSDVEIVAQPFDMNLFLEPGGRRGRGDDVQRARAGAGAGEPGHRRALHARRPERLPHVRPRHGRPRGRRLRDGGLDRRTRRTRISPPAS